MKFFNCFHVWYTHVRRLEIMLDIAFIIYLVAARVLSYYIC